MNTEMLEIKVKDDVKVVDSRLIALELGIQHKNFYQTIKDNQTDIEQAFGRLLFETETLNTAGGMQQVKFAYLNEDQATYLMTLCRNTPEVKKLKLKLVKSFSESKKKLTNNGQVSLDSQKVLLDAMTLMNQMSNTLENREKLLHQTIRSLSILEEERLEREYYLGQINEITKEHPLFSSLILFAMTLKREEYTFPSVGYKVSEILQMFPIKRCSEKRFANLCSDLYWLNYNKKPNESGVYKYTGEDLIYPTLILFKQEGYSWEELKEEIEIDYKCRFPASNRRALLEIVAKKERQLKSN